MNKRPADQRLAQAIRTICSPRVAAPAFALLGFSIVSVALAGPTGGVVVDGQATISTPAAGTTVIDQSSQHVQLNWNTFDVRTNETVQFQQPSSSAVALNRILDQNPSQIFGRIDANGQVILVNPNGMLFGASAQLNVGSLVASSLDVIGFDAATGRYTFGTSRTDTGAIVNDGAITAAHGGSVTLLGGRVANNGSIIADFGTVSLAAGRAATLDLAGDGLLRLTVDGELLSNNGGASAAVENGGVIEANGGRVLLTAKAVDDVFANLVNNTGVVRANRIDNSGGTIRLLGAGGTVRSSGVLDASAADDVSSGGTVEMLGEQVGLFDAALVDVSGATSGGTARIGGDYQGKNPEVLNAARTYVSSDASIRADAGAVGDGGRVIVWADEITRFNGAISARGGTVSGNGGFAEVSGKEHLVFRGQVDLTAANGSVGSLLLDPTNITIDNSSATDTDADDGTYAFGEDTGDATIGNATIETLLATTDVVLQATHDITQDADATIDVSGVAGASGNSLTLEAGENITLNGSIVMNDGAVTLIADSGGAPDTGGDGTGAITMADGSSIDAGSGAVSFTAAEDIRVTSISTTGAVTLASSAGAIVSDSDPSTLIRGGAITLSGTAIGSGANRIDTDATSLNATSSDGAIVITEANALSLTASATGGVVNVRTTDGALTVGAVTGAGVTLTAGGDGNGITLNGVVDAGTGFVTMLAGSSTSRGAIVAGSSGQVIAGTFTATGSSIGSGAVRLSTSVDSLNAVATSGGIFVTEADALSLAAGATGGAVDVQTTDGALTVASAAGDGVTLIAGGDGNGITLNGSVDAGSNNVTLTAGSALSRGAIVAGAGNLVSGDSLTATGSAIGTGADRLNTNIESLTATATNGGVFVTEANGLTLANVSAAGAGNDVSVTSTTGNIIATNVTATDDVTLTATAGSITAATITAGDAATLSASGAITDDNDNLTRIAAATLSLSAGTAIGASVGNGQLDTNVTSLTANAAAGGVYIGELNGLTLTNVSAAGAGNDVSVTSATGNIVVTTVSAPDVVTLTASAGDIVVANLSAGGAATLEANGAITDDDNDATVIAANSVSLSAGTNLGTVTNFAAANDADVGSSLDVQTSGLLTASVTSNNGQINLNVSGTPTLTAGAITLGAGPNRSGAVVLQSAGNLNVAGLATGAINIGSGNTTSVGLRSGGVLTLPSSGGFTDQPADRLLIRGATDVVDSGDANARELSFAATSLDFRSGAQGGATVLNTNVAQLSATVGNNQNLTVIETSGLTLGTLNAGSGVISLTASGAVLDDGDDLTRIVASSATLTGASLGTAGSALDTQVSTLNASATSGGVYVREVDALNLTASATGDAVDVRTAGGALTVESATGNRVTLVAGGAGSAITLNGAVNAGAGDVTLTAGTAASRGAVVAGIISHITGDALTLNASTIGTSGARLNTSVSSVNATSTSGGIFITESDAVSVEASASGGAVDVATTNGSMVVTQATGSAVTLVAGGAGSGITVNGAVNAGAGDVTLTAGTVANRGAIVAGGGNQVTGNSLTASASAIGSSAARLNTNVASLNATSTNGGIYIAESNALNLTANATGGAVDVATTNGALTVAQATGNGIALTAGGAGNGITLNGAVNGGAGDVTLTAGTPANRGAIVAGAGTHITANSLTASASAIGSSAARLNTTVGSLNATSTNGGIFVTETDALNLTASATNGVADVLTNGALSVTSVTGNGVILIADGAGSDITLDGTVNAGAGDVTLTAGTSASRGAIIAGAGNRIIGGALTATASAVGTGAARLNTTVASLDATTTNGGIFVSESDDLSLTASANGGAVNVETASGALTVASATGNGVTLTAGGGITLNGAVNAGAADVTLTAGTAASGGAIVGGAGHHITGNTLTAQGSAIGTSAARLNTTVAALNATSTNGGIFVAETDALSLSASADGGAADVQTGNGSLAVAALSADGVTLTAGGAGSGITLNGAMNARAGDVTLSAGTAASRGSIVGAASHSISGRALTATAAALGSSNARLNTNVDTLNATATIGDVYIAEQNGLTLANVNAARNIDVVSTAGDIVVSTVAAAQDVTLTANSGAIADDADDSTRLSANALTLRARSIGEASTLSGVTLNSAGRLDTTVQTLNATASAGGIFIDEADGLQNVTVQAAGGAAGDIELLTRTGDLNLRRVSASDTLLLSAGRNIFAGAGADPVTARVAELRAGTTDAAGGQIGTIADSIEFQLSAGNSLRLFVPQTVDPDDPNRAPATLPSAGVTTTLNLFASQNILAALAGFNQFQGLGETQFSSPAETLVRTLQSQTGTVQTGLDIDWGSFDPDVSLFGTLEPSVCLPADQRDEESSTPDC